MSYYEFHVSRRYVQYEGALAELPRYAASIGKKLLILVAAIPERVEPVIERAMRTATADALQPQLEMENPRYAGFRAKAGDCDAMRADMSYEFREIVDVVPSEGNIRAVADYVRAEGFDTVVGIGGGRGMDFARGITHFVPVKVILVPTLAATNAPISTLSVIYSDDGNTIVDYWRMDNAPDLTLVDTGILLDNPPQALAAGIGDITCTYYEGLCNLALSGRESAYPDLSTRGLRLAVEIMRERAPQAMEALRQHRITPEFESVLSMILHNCGPLWTACNMGLAHVLDELFLHFPQAHAWSHGLRVGFATIPMLMYANVPQAELDAYIDLCRAVGIPTSLHEMGMDAISLPEWEQAAAATIEKRGALKSLPFAAKLEDVLNCLLKCR